MRKPRQKRQAPTKRTLEVRILLTAEEREAFDAAIRRCYREGASYGQAGRRAVMEFVDRMRAIPEEKEA